VGTLKRDSRLRRKFESYARHEYAQENVEFLEDVLEWRTHHQKDRSRAEWILNKYIPEGAPSQINISCKSRVGILDTFRSQGDEISSDIFDSAVREITSLMVDGGVWNSFVWRGGCDRAESLENVDQDTEKRVALTIC
jgi:hypothetical protein